MKYAIISDIHGNNIALQEALKQIDEENVAKIICLGDIIGIGVRSEECVKMIKKYGDRFIGVMGNHEDRILHGIPDYIHNGQHKMTEEDFAQEYWVRDNISQESKDFLEKLPQEQVVELENVRFALTHYPLDENMEYKKFLYYPSKEEFEELFSKYDARVNLFGHTHTGRVRETSDGRWYINPGTLGTTDFKDYGTYGILTIDDGKISYVEKGFHYDLKAYLDDFEVMNPPKKDHMRDKFFGYKR